MAAKFTDHFPKIILFGDSLTQFSFSPDGFGSAIANHFQRRCDVLNRGFSGYTTRSDKLILPQLLKNDNQPKGLIAAAVILLGTNDSEDVNVKNSRHVPIAEYKEHLKDICGQFRDVGVSFEKQVLITPPCMDEEQWALHCQEKGYEVAMRNEFITLYAKACLESGHELGIEVFDLWRAMKKEQNWNDLLSDGLHLSERGNRFVAEGLIPILDRKLSGLSMVFPDWHDVHPSHPEKVLGNYVNYL